MGDPKKKKGGSKAGPLLLLVLLVVGGAGVAGYLKPDLPVVGPLVAKFVTKAAENVDKSGTYRVTITQVVLSPEEFRDGERVDIQVSIRHIGANGNTKQTWETRQFGARIARVGETSLTAAWSDRPVEFEWETGDHFVVTVTDRAGVGSTDLCVWETNPESREFPLSGTHTFERVRGKIARVKGANQIVFDSSRIE